MKLLHTADWHLGKTLKGQSLLDDQVFILEQIFDIIDEQKPDAILICGDIYDRAVPPADAVELFDETLTKLAEKKLPTLIIAGNHDSATRLNFGSKIFERQNIFIASKDLETPETVILEDNFGEVYFTMIPYFDFGDIQAKLSSAQQKIPSGKRSVAIAHVFLTGGVESALITSRWDIYIVRKKFRLKIFVTQVHRLNTHSMRQIIKNPLRLSNWTPKISFAPKKSI